MSVRKLTTDQLNHILGLQTVSQEAPAPAAHLLRQLAAIDRNLLSNLMIEQHCVAGEIICHEGDRGDAMYVIWSGRVVVLKGDLDAPTILGYRGPGEIIGEMALLDDQPRSATNVALEPLHLLKIERERFLQWLSTSPSLGLSIMATLSMRLRDASNDIAIDAQVGRHLIQQVSELESEKQQLLELQRVRQETSDLIVHDLRNPLGVIYGTLTMLEMVLPDEILTINRELLDLAIAACERMQRLVDSLLDVAKFETGEMTISLALTNLIPVLKETIAQQSIPAQARKVTLFLDASENLPSIVVDRGKLERVLTNLIDNALKYTPEGGQIIVSAKDNRDFITIRVIDEGPGIPPEERTRIFERFAQIENEITARRGFGLGLTFCRLAVEAHGGEIWVEPGPNGKGSCFAFTLPFTSPTDQ